MRLIKKDRKKKKKERNGLITGLKFQHVTSNTEGRGIVKLQEVDKRFANRGPSALDQVEKLLEKKTSSYLTLYF